MVGGSIAGSSRCACSIVWTAARGNPGVVTRAQCNLVWQHMSRWLTHPLQRAHTAVLWYPTCCETTNVCIPRILAQLCVSVLDSTLNCSYTPARVGSSPEMYTDTHLCQLSLEEGLQLLHSGRGQVAAAHRAAPTHAGCLQQMTQTTAEERQRSAEREQQKVRDRADV
jgi:hypothetical protein